MVFKGFLVLLAAYLIGAIPVGWVIVKIFKGKDVRTLGSGRVGGTNVMRAAGLIPGILTAAGDAGKGILAGYIASSILPGSVWIKVAAVTLAVIGQIFSVFLAEKSIDGKVIFRGGAGGSTTLGSAIALWPSIWYIILPLVVLVYILIGYASVTTISIAFLSLVIFGYTAVSGQLPWQFVLFGVASLVIVLDALRPNLERLRAGTERPVGLRAYFRKKFEQNPK